ncbi:MAG: efflux RND transporter periplasmic adaptor subunit [Bacteroidia bacterium]|nr:efflux RND transporter periplasmic adaptor subunit [Bacteroidia bacterium]
MKKILFLSGIVTLAACGNNKEEGATTNTDSLSTLPIVSVQTIEQSSFEHFFELQGTLHSEQEALINPEFAGTIKTIHVKVGDRVSKGQTIAIINTDIVQSNLLELKKNLEMVTLVYEKQKNLWEQKIGTEIQFIEAKTRKESLEQSVKTGETQLSKGTVIAPFNGVVDDVFVKVGEMANPAMPIARIVNLDEMYAIAEVPENYLGVVKTGTEVRVKIAQLNYDKRAKISRMGSYIEPNNRSFKAQIDLENANQQLIPNLISTVQIRDYHKDSVIVVPSAGILQDAQGNNFVYTLNADMIAKKVLIKTGKAFDGKTLVEEGVKIGDKIVVDGVRGINENDKVQEKK